MKYIKMIRQSIWSWSYLLLCKNFDRYCEGGELFKYINERQFLTEETAAIIMK